jgi:hypothetical protein
MSVMTEVDSEKVGASTRPASIVWYERLSLAAIAISLASVAANPALIAVSYRLYSMGYVILLVGLYAVQLLWIWLIARKRQNWARWISLVFIIFGILGAILDFDVRFRLGAASAIVSYVGFGVLTVAVALLFRSDAGRWFAGQPLAPDSAASS